MTARDFCLSMGADYIQNLAQDLLEHGAKCEWVLRTALAIDPNEDANDIETVARAFTRTEREQPGIDLQKVRDIFHTMLLTRLTAAGLLYPEDYAAEGCGGVDQYALAERLIELLE